MHEPLLGPAAELSVLCTDGEVRVIYLCELPFYDPQGDIRTGRSVEIPDIVNG
jgi:hypothetical protein